MLARQIADLARLRRARVAGRDLAADERVQVGTRGGAVAAGGDGGFVDVVDYVQESRISRCRDSRFGESGFLEENG